MPDPLPQVMPDAAPTRRWPRIALYSLVFLGGMFVCFQPTILSGFQRMQTDPGDPVLNHYFLEHSWRWLSDANYPASFWSPRFFYPAQHVLAYSENMIGAAPLYWGLRLVFNEEISWQWWILIISALNYVAMLIVLRWFGVHPVLAVLGAFLFAFGLPRQDQFAHEQLLPQAFAPFAVWYFWKFLQTADRRSWFMVLLLTAWQLLASIHLGWFLLFAFGIVWLTLLVIGRSMLRSYWTFFRQHPIFVLATGAIWIVGLWQFFRNYYKGNLNVRRDFSECLYFMPKWTAWFACPPNSLWDLRLVSGEHEQYAERHLFTGFGFYFILFVGLFAAWRSRKDEASRPRALFSIALILTCLTLVVLTLYYAENITPWQGIFMYFPGANAFRAIGRVWFVVILLGLIGGLVALQRMLETNIRTPAIRNAVFALLAIVAIGEQIRFEMESFNRNDFYPRARMLSREFTDADVAFVYFDPSFIEHDYEHAITCMWAGMWANTPVVNGFSGRLPNGYFGDPWDVSIERIVQTFRPEWSGTLLVIRFGTRLQKKRYQIKPGEIAAERIAEIVSDSPKETPGK